MKIRITYEINDGRTLLRPGQYVDASDEVARDWIAFGLAVDASEVSEENLVEITPEIPEKGKPEPVEDDIVEVAPESSEPKPPAKKVAAKKTTARPRKES